MWNLNNEQILNATFIGGLKFMFICYFSFFKVYILTILDFPYFSTCNCFRWFLDGKSIGLQIRCMMETWLSFRAKRRSFMPNPRMNLVMLISSTQKSHLLRHKQIVLSWHFETGWGGMATANPSGLSLVTNNPYRQWFYQNVRWGARK